MEVLKGKYERKNNREFKIPNCLFQNTDLEKTNVSLQFPNLSYSHTYI